MNGAEFLANVGTRECRQGSRHAAGRARRRAADLHRLVLRHRDRHRVRRAVPGQRPGDDPGRGDRSERRSGRRGRSPRQRVSSRRSTTTRSGARTRRAARWAPTRPRRPPSSRHLSGRCSTHRCRWPTAGCSVSATPITGTNEAMYSASQWESLSAALTDLANGNGTALMGIADSYDGRDAQGHYSNLLDAFVAIGCIDGSQDGSGGPDRRARRRRCAEAAPYQATGDPPRGVHDPCAFWPATPARGRTSDRSPSGLPRVLVISTTHDPATPYEAGVKLAEDARRRPADRRRHQPHRLPRRRQQVRRHHRHRPT